MERQDQHYVGRQTREIGSPAQGEEVEDQSRDGRAVLNETRALSVGLRQKMKSMSELCLPQ